ncbi:hypothetical protein P5V15_014036 [Pogonomyrmex californicus]
MVLIDTPGVAFDKVAMDVMGPLPKTKRGNKYILMIQDLLIKYSIAIPMEDTSATTTAELLGPLPKTKRGNKYILMIQDLLIKYSIAISMEDTSATTTAEPFHLPIWMLDRAF